MSGHKVKLAVGTSLGHAFPQPAVSLGSARDLLWRLPRIKACLGHEAQTDGIGFGLVGSRVGESAVSDVSLEELELTGEGT